MGNFEELEPIVMEGVDSEISGHGKEIAIEMKREEE